MCIKGGNFLDILELCGDLNPSNPVLLPKFLPLLVPEPVAYDVFSDFLFPWIEEHHQTRIPDKYGHLYFI